MKAAEEVEAKVGRLLRGEWGGELMTGRIDLTSPGSNTMQKGRGGGSRFSFSMLFLSSGIEMPYFRGTVILKGQCKSVHA